MNAEFQWWLLILGIVIGGALVYLVLADLQGDPNLDDLDESPDVGPADDEAGDEAEDEADDDAGADDYLADLGAGDEEPADA